MEGQHTTVRWSNDEEGQRLPLMIDLILLSTILDVLIL